MRALLSEREFWKRAWIFQEIVLAKDIRFKCGAHKLELEAVNEIDFALKIYLPDAGARKLIDHLEPKVWCSFRSALGTLWEISRRSTFKVSLNLGAEPLADSRPWMLLRHTKELTATNPRDKIYSLLGLFDFGVIADYSISTESLYLQIATIILKSVPLDEWLDMSATRPQERIKGLPTWVIDWNALSKGLCWQSSLQSDLYDVAATFHPFSNLPKIGNRILTVFGAMFDSILTLGPLPEKEDNFIDWNAPNSHPQYPNRDLSEGAVPSLPFSERVGRNIMFLPAEPLFSYLHESMVCGTSITSQTSSSRPTMSDYVLAVLGDYFDSSLTFGPLRSRTSKPRNKGLADFEFDMSRKNFTENELFRLPNGTPRGQSSLALLFRDRITQGKY